MATTAPMRVAASQATTHAGLFGAQQGDVAALPDPVGEERPGQAPSASTWAKVSAHRPAPPTAGRRSAWPVRG